MTGEVHEAHLFIAVLGASSYTHRQVAGLYPRLEGYEVNITDGQIKGAPKYGTHENWDWRGRTRSVDDYYKVPPNWMV